MSSRPTALITGASAGIGREFARQLASRGHDLIVVARDEERLTALATELTAAYGVEVEVLPADLADHAAVNRVAARLADADRPVDLLVNNAGLGLRKRFLDNEVGVEVAAFDVMARAVMVLSHAAGRAMRSRGRGRIINVSSVAGFMAQGTYSAAKAFVTTFSEGLAAELAGTGVTVTALCPGFVTTEFHERAQLKRIGPDFAWLDVQRLVSDCLTDVAAGKIVSVPSLQYKAAVGLLRFAPRSLIRRAGIARKK